MTTVFRADDCRRVACSSDDDLRAKFERFPALLAVVNGDIDGVRAVIAAGEQISQRAGDHTMLSVAILRRKYEIVDALIAAGADLNRVVDFFTTAVNVAVLSGDIRMVERVLAAGSNPNKRDVYMRTIFDCAACLPDTEMLAFLLQNAPRDVLFHASRTSSLFTYAAANKNETVLALVLRQLDGLSLREFGANANDYCLRDSIRCLALVAAENPNVAVLELLIAHGCDVNVTDWDGMTPCHIAASSSNLDVLVRLLAVKGVQTDRRDRWHRTVCHVAAGSSNPLILKAVIDAGVALNAPDLLGRSPIWSTISNIDHMRMLLAAGVDFESPDCTDTTLLSAAVTKGSHDAVRLLLEAGADVRRRDRVGRTVAHHAAASGDAITVALVRDAGADFHAKNNHGETPLVVAVSELASVDVVQLLINCNVDINCVDRRGYGALAIALSKQSYDSATLLLAAGAAVDEFDLSGMTLCHRAAMSTAALLRGVIRRGVDPHAVDHLGRNAAHYAATTACFAVLFAIGVDLNLVDANGRAPMSLRMYGDGFPTLLAAGAGAHLMSTPWLGNSRAALTVAAGYALHPTVRTVPDESVAAATRDLMERQVVLMKARAAEVCIALQARQLPALVTCSILEHAFDPVPCFVPLYMLYAISRTAKHFLDN